MSRSKDDFVTRRELAGAIGYHPRTVARFLEEGMPVARRGRGGRPNLFSVAAVHAWLAKRDGAEPRIRRDHWRARLLEQTLNRLRARHVPAAEVEIAHRQLNDEVRTRLRALPGALAPVLHRIAVTEGPGAMEKALTEAVRAVLTELAEGGSR